MRADAGRDEAANAPDARVQVGSGTVLGRHRGARSAGAAGADASARDPRGYRARNSAAPGSRKSTGNTAGRIAPLLRTMTGRLRPICGRQLLKGGASLGAAS